MVSCHLEHRYYKYPKATATIFQLYQDDHLYRWENQISWRKALTFFKSLTNLYVYTLIVIATECIDKCSPTTILSGKTLALVL